MKTNNKCAAVRLEKSKLVAAIAVLAMVVCAFAVLAPVAEETDTTATGIVADPLKDKAQVDGTLTYDETSKIYTIGSAATITLKSNVELKQVRFAGNYALTIASEANAVKTLTVNYDFNGKTGENNIFAVSSLTLNNVNLTVVQKDTGRTTGPGEAEAKNSVFGNMAVTVDGKSIMTVTCDENSNRVFYNNSSTLTINGATAKVVMDQATSMTVKLVMTGGSTLEIKNPRGTAGNFYPAITNGGNSKITVTDGSNSTIRFYANDGSTGIASLEGVTITADCPVALYNNTNNTSNAAEFYFDGSTINATKVVIAQSGTNENGVTLKNGTFNVDAISDESISKPNKTNPPAITPVYTLDKTVFKGQTAVDAGVTLLGTAKFSAIGDSLEFAKGAKLGDQGTAFVISNTAGGNTNSISLKATAGENGLKMVAGSVEISGEILTTTALAAAIDAASGDVILKNVTITNSNTTSTTALTIPNTVKIEGLLTISKDTNVVINTADADVKGTIIAETGSDVTVATINVAAKTIGEVKVGSSTTTGTAASMIVNDLADIKAAVADGRVFDLQAAGNITISEKYAFPAGFTLNMGNYELIILDTTFTNDGTIIVDAGKLKIGNDTTGTTPLAKPTSILVNNGEIKTAGAITVNADGKIENSGAISKNGGSAHAVTGNGTFENLTGGVVGFAVNTKKVEGVSYDVNMTTDITQDTVFGSLQNVIIPEGQTLTIQRTAVMTIMGKLTVNGTLNVEGELIIAGASGASMEINGTVNVTAEKTPAGKLTIGKTGESGVATITSTGKLIATEKATVEIDNGAIIVDGTMEMQNASILKSSVAPAAEVTIKGHEAPATGLVVTSAGSLTLQGYFDPAGVKVLSMGAVVLDNASVTAKTNGSLIVYLGSKDASFVIKSTLLYGGTVTVTDEGLVLKDYSKQTADGNKRDVVTSANANSIVFTGATSVDYTKMNGEVKFVESVVAKTGVDKKISYTHTIDVAGTIAGVPVSSTLTSFENVKMTAGINGTGEQAATATNFSDFKKAVGGVTVSGDLTIGAYVAVNNNGKLAVSGNVVINDTNARQMTNAGTGIITVSGKIAISTADTAKIKQIANTGIISAAYYEIVTGSGTSKVTTYTYSTLEAAVPAVADASNVNTNKDIKIMGSSDYPVVVKNDLEIVKGVTVTLDRDAKLVVGASDNRDIVLTVADGSKMTSAKNQVEVFATLTFVNKTNDATVGTISDVTVEDESKTGSRTYTNIYTSIAKSNPGDVINVTRSTDEGYLELDKNLTIPDGVTLVASDRYDALLLKNGVTLTIDGTLVAEQAVYAEKLFGITAMNVVGEKESSAIVVNGTMKVASDVSFAYGNNTAATSTAYASIATNAPIAGAYYEIENYRVVSSLKIAADSVENIQSDITVNGPVVAGDIVFNATDDCTTIVIGYATDVVKAPASADKVYTSLTVTSLTINGGKLFANGFLNGNVIVGEATLAASNIKNLKVADSEGMVVFGAPVNADNVLSTKASLKLTAGTAIFKTVDSVAFDSKIAFTVSNGAVAEIDNATFTGKLTIEGTVSVKSGKTLTAGTVVVKDNGVLAVESSSSTTSEGIANVDALYVGIAKKDYYKSTSSAAAVSGPVAVAKTAYIADGTTISEELSTALTGSTYKSTAFYVDGKIWFTAYALASLSDSEKAITVNQAPVENAILSGWSKTKNGTVDVEKTASMKIGDNTKLYAVVVKDIYNIVIKADEGIADVYINGQAMFYGLVADANETGYYYAYTATVSAGDYKVTYTLKNGWSGDAKLTGDNISGMSFKVSGTPADDKPIQKVYQLSGVEKSGYVEPVTPSEDDGNDGLTITDYLLIVLVVLIVILAVIVAMRLMRS